MDADFRSAISVLNQHNLDFFLCHGTLLGVIREESLLESDPDIDIGLLGSQSDNIQNLCSVMEDDGYTVVQKQYHGTVFQIDLVPDGWPETFPPRKISIHIYRLSRDQLWCPAARAHGRVSYHGYDPRHYLFRLSRSLLLSYYETKERREVAEFPWSAFFDLYTLQIPAAMIKPLRYDSDLDCHIPNSPETYLEYKYGEWETPVDDWNSWEDDNELYDVDPTDLINELTAQ